MGHSLFSKSDGGLWVTGDNRHGQLGIGFTPGQINIPEEVLSSGVQRVAAGEFHSLCLVGGSLWVMGYNGFGQLGDGTTNDHFFPEKIFSATPGFLGVRATAMAGGSFHSLFATYQATFIGDNNLYAMGANGVCGEILYTLTTSNLPQLVSQWQSVSTNVLSANGNFTMTAANAVAPGAGQQFYILQAQ